MLVLKRFCPDLTNCLKGWVDTMWNHIYKCLKENGIDVYSPAQHEGECTSPYTVVNISTRAQIGSFSSTDTLYDIMCYVPKKAYSTLEPYKERVKEVLKGLYPMLIDNHYETAAFYDDSIKGHMISMEYKTHRKI